MSSHLKGEIVKLKATAAITEGQIVSIASDTTVTAADATAKNFGVAQACGAGVGAGDELDVAIGGGTLVRLGGTVTAGASLKADANGLAIAVVAGAGAGLALGIALQAGVANDFISMKIDRHELST